MESGVEPLQLSFAPQADVPIRLGEKSLVAVGDFNGDKVDDLALAAGDWAARRRRQ